MINGLITPQFTVLDIPELYTKNIPNQEQLDSIEDNDIVLIGINTGLEDTWYTEFFAVSIYYSNEGHLKGTIINNLSLTVAHGLHTDSEIEFYEDHVFAILSEKEYIEMFE
jgi:hypothetical protein